MTPLLHNVSPRGIDDWVLAVIANGNDGNPIHLRTLLIAASRAGSYSVTERSVDRSLQRLRKHGLVKWCGKLGWRLAATQEAGAQ